MYDVFESWVVELQSVKSPKNKKTTNTIVLFLPRKHFNPLEGSSWTLHNDCVPLQNDVNFYIVQNHLPENGAGYSGQAFPTSINHQTNPSQTNPPSNMNWEISPLRLLSQVTLGLIKLTKLVSNYI